MFCWHTAKGATQPSSGPGVQHIVLGGGTGCPGPGGSFYLGRAWWAPADELLQLWQALSQQTCLPAGAAMPWGWSSPHMSEQTPTLTYNQNPNNSYHANQLESVENPGMANLFGTFSF